MRDIKMSDTKLTNASKCQIQLEKHLNEFIAELPVTVVDLWFGGVMERERKGGGENGSKCNTIKILN